jgi:hypothetical protein
MKVVQIILIPKPWNPPQRSNILSPNKPPTHHIQKPRKPSLKKTPPNVGKNQLIPNHQFGFRQRHSTIEQIHRTLQRINEALERKQYCSATFLNITQAFDKVWHTGLLYKLKLSLPLNYFIISKSYQQNKHFLLKIKNDYAELSPVNAGVPQGSVFRSLLYLLFTADLPISPETTSATFADDTAVIATDSDPAITSTIVETNLLAIQSWLAK